MEMGDDSGSEMGSSEESSFSVVCENLDSSVTAEFFQFNSIHFILGLVENASIFNFEDAIHLLLTWISFAPEDRRRHLMDVLKSSKLNWATCETIDLVQNTIVDQASQAEFNRILQQIRQPITDLGVQFRIIHGKDYMVKVADFQCNEWKWNASSVPPCSFQIKRAVPKPHSNEILLMGELENCYYNPVTGTLTPLPPRPFPLDHEHDACIIEDHIMVTVSPTGDEPIYHLLHYDGNIWNAKTTKFLKHGLPLIGEIKIFPHQNNALLLLYRTDEVRIQQIHLFTYSFATKQIAKLRSPRIRLVVGLDLTLFATHQNKLFIFPHNMSSEPDYACIQSVDMNINIQNPHAYHKLNNLPTYFNLIEACSIETGIVLTFTYGKRPNSTLITLFNPSQNKLQVLGYLPFKMEKVSITSF